MNQTFRAFIVDDEPMARERIRRMLKAHTDIEIAGECENGEDAVAAVRHSHPDLLFLDIQMPLMDGFEVLRNLDSEELPYVIFITAFDEYAVRAFEVHALDYLLKPFDSERFQSAVNRARDRIKTDRAAATRQEITTLLEDLRGAGARYLDRLTLKRSGRLFLVPCDKVDYIESEAKFVRVFVGKESFTVRLPISSLEKQLDPRRFVRIHRCTIVNAERVREFQPLFHGDYRVLLHNGTALTMSRTYRDAVFKTLKILS